MVLDGHARSGVRSTSPGTRSSTGPDDTAQTPPRTGDGNGCGSGVVHMARMTVWSHRASFPAEAGSAGRAREFVRDRLVEHDLRYLVDDVRLVASELATNATVHARTAFTIRLERLGGVVFLVVQDGSASPPHTGGTDVSDT